MDDLNDNHSRLKHARIAAGFKSARSAALRFGWKPSTYGGHENGQNDYDEETAEAYGKAFRVDPAWLLLGTHGDNSDLCAVVGFVGAGTETNFVQDGYGVPEYDLAECPPNSTTRTVAVMVRGDSMAGIADDGAILYYDARRSRPTPDMFNRLCVVGLEDDRVLVKRLVPGSGPGLFHLLSSNAPPMLDQAVAWAARVTWIKPG